MKFNKILKDYLIFKKFLTYNELKKFHRHIYVSIFLNFLDLFAISLIALIGSVVANKDFFNIILIFKKLMQKYISLNQTSLVLVIISLTMTILIIRSILNLMYLNKSTIFLSSLMYKINSINSQNLFLNDLNNQQKFTPQAFYHINHYSTLQSILIFGSSIITLISDFLLIILMFIFIIWYSFDIAILVVTIFTLAGILFQKYTRKTISAFSSTISDYSTSANFLIKFINSNYRTLRVSPEILLTINELNNYWKKLSQARQKQLQIQSLPKIYFEIIFSASALAIILFEYTRYGNFELALVSKLITYLFIASRLLPALIRLNSALTGIKSSHVEINKLGHFYQSQQVPTYKVDYDRNVFEEVDAIDISLNNVSFKYDNREIFKNLNFEFKFGSHTLIFGDSGSGKSTLIDLLLGLRQVNEGKIEINGANPFEFINNFPGVISYVGPNYYFGKTTFKTFLKNSKLLNDGSSGQIEKVLKLVNLYTEINDNRDSLETVIEQESGNFSNGQKQRLAIARSLLHNPKVLILDESLNALDEKSQLLLLRGIIDWQINKTLIVVSHNLEFKKLFRNILFL